MVHFHPTLALPLLTVATCVPIVAPLMMTAKDQESLRASERKLFLHSWQLRQLLPEQARGQMSIPPPDFGGCHYAQHRAARRARRAAAARG
jgi:hypothetical protein